MEEMNNFPKVAKTELVTMTSWNKLYDYLYKLDTSPSDLEKTEEIESVKDSEWTVTTKKYTHYFEKTADGYKYVCSQMERKVNRKFRCIGGPFDGTNIVGRFPKDYSIFNNADLHNEVPSQFTAVLIHKSLLS